MRFLKVAFSLVVTALTFVGVFGCGGSGGSGASALNPFRGVYRGAFTRAADAYSELVIGVNRDGSASAVISNADGILFIGYGKPLKDGTCTMLATPPQNFGNALLPIEQVNIAATLYLLVDPVDTEGGFAATLTGAINESVGGPRFQEPKVTCPYSGGYTGSFSGDDSGSFALIVNAQGITAGNSHADAGDFSMNGQVNNDGSVTLQVDTFAGGMTWTGYVFMLPGTNLFSGLGSWTSKSGHSGTWQCSGHILFR